MREEGAVFELFLPLTLSTVERKGGEYSLELFFCLTPSTVEREEVASFELFFTLTDYPKREGGGCSFLIILHLDTI